MPRRESVDYVPTQADKQFLTVASAFKFVRVGNAVPTLKELAKKLGTTNYYTLKRWRYRLVHIPNDLPYGDMTAQSAADHLTAIAKDILKLDDAVNQPFSENSEYVDPNAKPKFVADEMRNKPLDGVYDYEYNFTDEDLKNFKPFPGSE